MKAETTLLKETKETREQQGVRKEFVQSILCICLKWSLCIYYHVQPKYKNANQLNMFIWISYQNQIEMDKKHIHARPPTHRVCEKRLSNYPVLKCLHQIGVGNWMFSSHTHALCLLWFTSSHLLIGKKKAEFYSAVLHLTVINVLQFFSF